MDFKKHENSKSKPNRFGYPGRYKCINCISRIQTESNFCANCGMDITESRSKAISSYKADMKEWHEEEARRLLSFKEDVLKMSGFGNHPKSEAIYSFASDFADGRMSEIYNLLCDLHDALES